MEASSTTKVLCTIGVFTWYNYDRKCRESDASSKNPQQRLTIKSLNLNWKCMEDVSVQMKFIMNCSHSLICIFMGNYRSQFVYRSNINQHFQQNSFTVSCQISHPQKSYVCTIDQPYVRYTLHANNEKNSFLFQIKSEDTLFRLASEKC